MDFQYVDSVNNRISIIRSQRNNILPTVIIDLWVNIIIKIIVRNGQREGNVIHFIFTYIFSQIFTKNWFMSKHYNL